jgi:hypothetical protein
LIIHGLVAVVLDEFVTFGGFKVFANHFSNKLFEGGLGSPS